MKTAIIGNNSQAANFIENCEIVKNYVDANVIVCAGNINWRSLYQKFNKFSPNQVVVAFNDNGELFRSKYNFYSINLMQKNLNETIDIIYKDHIYQGLFKGSKCFLPFKSNYIIHCTTEFNFCRIGRLKDPQMRDLYTYGIPIVIEFYSNELPNLIIVQLDLNKFSNYQISKIINNRLCELVHSH